MATKKKTEKPVQLSIWEILEHPLFEKNLTSEMKILEYAGKNYQALKMKIEEQYKKDLATLEMAKEGGMKELLHDYSTPEDFTIKYVEVITKKSRLSAHKRELIENFFGPIVKGTAIDIINEKKSHATLNKTRRRTQRSSLRAKNFLFSLSLHFSPEQ